MKVIILGQIITLGMAFFLKMNVWAVLLSLGMSFGATLFLRKMNEIAEGKKKDFFQLTQYMQSMAMSFMISGSEYTALQETIPLFEESKMKNNLREALKYMEESKDGRGSESAFLFLERRYSCKRLKILHRYLLMSAQVGGAYEHGIRVLLKDQEQWKKRQMVESTELSQDGRKIKISILFTVLLCGFVTRMTGGEVDISAFAVYQVGVTVFWLGCLVLLVIGEKISAMNWIDEERAYTEDELRKKLLSYMDKSKKEKGGRPLRKNILQRQLLSVFPEWILEVVLRMENTNVEVALQESYEHAPVIIKYFLRRMLGQLKERPGEGEPFFCFACELQIPEIATSKKLLYGVSKGAIRDGREQIQELVERNYEIENKAKEHRQEQRRSLLYGYALLPSILGAGCMILNMSLLLIGFVGSMQV